MTIIDFSDDVAEYNLSEKNDIYKDLLLWKDRYIEDKKANKVKEKTIKSYENAISPFLSFCELYKKQMKIEMITARFVNRYLLWYQIELAKISHSKKKLSKTQLNSLIKENEKKELGINDKTFKILEQYESTLSHRLVVLKDFLKFVTENNKEQHDFTQLFGKFARVKISEKMTQYLTPKELAKVIEEMLDWPDAYKGANRKPKSSLRYAYRNSLLILIYCFTGARSEEVVNIKLKDLIEEDNYYVLKIEQGKGGRKRALAIDKKYLKTHIDYLRGELPSDEYYLSSPYTIGKGYSNKPMSPNTIRDFENFILKLLNIKKSGLHAVRRGYATKRIVVDGKDISTVAKELGNTVAILEKHYYKHNPEFMAKEMESENAK